MKLYPYKEGSASAKSLAQALGIKRIRHEGKPLTLRCPVINWGCSNPTRNLLFTDVLFNNFDAVKKASNKLETFKALDGRVCIPEWTESPVEAVKWLVEGDVVVREKLNGHSGEGITILPQGDYLDGILLAPLYTKYIKKKDEYRIHVFQGDAFFVQRKARKKDVPDDQVNWQVRNHANGFIFANQDVEVSDDARREACNAVACLGLDFGAVDIILGTDRKWYVLEVNTACGLEGKTLEAYVAKFKQLGY